MLFKKIGFNNDDKLIKKMKVGIIDNKNKNKNKSRNINHLVKKKLKNLHKNVNNSRNSIKYFSKDFSSFNLNNKMNRSSSIIIDKNFLSVKSNIKKKEDKKEKLDLYKKLYIKNINKSLGKITHEIKSIDNKINEHFNQIKEGFEKEAKEIFTNY